LASTPFLLLSEIKAQFHLMKRLSDTISVM
jgi:hypothetical protein